MTETANVDYTERNERRPWAEAAASYGRDVHKMLAAGDDPDDIRLQARCAMRCASRAIEEGGV